MSILGNNVILGDAGVRTYVEDVFSTYLYTGNGSTQTITNGIDLSGKGGLVWIKGRSGATGNRLTDTARGATKSLESNSTTAEVTESTGLTSFSSTGFALGADADYSTNAATYASWTFRKAPKFFDVVTYTGNGVDNRTISHSLGSTPGFIIVKQLVGGAHWSAWHRSIDDGYNLYLNLTNSIDTYNDFENAGINSTGFAINATGSGGINTNSNTYVAYVFAHDAGGFGDTGNDSVVKCGSFTTDGIGAATVSLGYEPQWVLFKKYSGGAENWYLFDNMRGMPVGSADAELFANLSNAEATSYNYINPTATGFNVLNLSSSAGYIYIAIRRGPMKTPTVGTQVFKANTYTGNGSLLSITGAGFPPDFSFTTRRDTASWVTTDKLRGAPLSLYAQSTAVEVDNIIYEVRSYDQDGVTYGQNSIVNGSSSPLVNYLFRRAPGFFDVVAYTGTGSATTFSHNLGVVPELILVKGRSTAYSWWVYNKDIGNTKYLQLQLDGGASTFDLWNNTSPTSSVFSLSNYASINNSGSTFIAYLFASCPGVSKVFNYTGTGTTLQINCGFTSGARLVLIKRTDSTGDWYIWDSARGIISGNDPYLLLNSTAAEVTNTDYIDPYSAGFEISSTAPAAINANGGSYIGLAVA